MSQEKEVPEIEKGGKQPTYLTIDKQMIIDNILSQGLKVCIVLHGEFRNNGSQTEDKQGDGGKLSTHISGLSWEVFGDSSSLTGVQAVAEEDLNSLTAIDDYIHSLHGFSISFLVTDMRILGLINEIGFDWTTKFPFYDILHVFNSVHSQSKNNLAEIFELLDIPEDNQEEKKFGQSELFMASQKLSRVVASLIQGSSEFKDPLNNEELINTQKEQPNFDDDNDGWGLPSENQDKQLDDEEVWGKTPEKTTIQENAPSQALSQELPARQQEKVPENSQSSSEQPLSQNVLSTLIAPKLSSAEKRERSRSRSYEKNNRQAQQSSATDSEGGQKQSQPNPEQQQNYHNSHFSSRQARNEENQEDSETSDNGLYLRLRGLPFNARERELFEFLGFTLEPDQIYFRYDPMGRFLGECVLRLVDQKQQERISSMHMRNMGKRYIEVFPANKSDFSRAQESQSFEGDRKTEEAASGSSYDSDFLKNIGIVKVRGLPYESNDADIQSFFKDSTIISNGIQKVFEGRRPSGEAFILFATKADADKALDKDKQRMGTRYIEIFLCHPKEYTNYIKSRKSFSGGYQGGYNNNYQGNNYNPGYSNHHQGGYGQGEYSRGGSTYAGRYDKYPDSNRYENRYGGYNNRNDNGNYGNNGGQQQGYYKKPYQPRYGEESGSRYGDDKYGNKPGYNQNSRPYNNYNKYDPSKSRYNNGKRDDYNSGYQSYDQSATQQQNYSNTNPYVQYQQDTSATSGAADPSQQQNYQYYGQQYQYPVAGTTTASTQSYIPTGASDSQYQQYPQGYQQQQYAQPYYQQGVQNQQDAYAQQQQQYTQPSQAVTAPPSQYYPQGGQPYEAAAKYSYY